MLRLYGYAVSNYFNSARQALIEKQADFAIERVRASRDPAFLARSPLGKIPFLQTAQGDLSETLPIFEYLEETLPGPRLYPDDPLQRARVRQLMNIVQLYLDAPMRRLYAGTVMGRVHLPGAVDAVALQLESSIEALRRLLVLRPFLLGDRLSYADLLALYCVDIGDRVTRQVYGWSLIERIDGLAAWGEHMTRRDSTRVVAAEFMQQFSIYLADKQAAYRLDQGGGIFTPASSSELPS